MFASPSVDSLDDNCVEDNDDHNYNHCNKRNYQAMEDNDNSSSSDDEDTKEVSSNVLSSSVSVKVRIWSGNPGTAAGHVATDVSSYFSRLWKNGNKSRVWYLYLCAIK